MRKLTLFTKKELSFFKGQRPLFNDEQMKIINRKTPESEIEIKTDKNGVKYKSVKASYVKALLMLVTGGNYSFEIKSKEYIPSSKEILVEGCLSISYFGKVINREQFGRHYLAIKTNTSGNITTSYASDMGSGYKAAASDCLKKCASEFGFCWDIYSPHPEAKQSKPEMSHAEQKKLERLLFFLLEAKTTEQLENTYTEFLKTSEETEASKNLCKEHMNRIIKLNQTHKK